MLSRLFLSTFTASSFDLCATSSRAPYIIDSATLFLPASIRVLMSLATTLSLNFGSGRITLLGTSLLLGIYIPSAKQVQYYFGRLAPYLERLCRRPLTPTESSVRRTM